MIALHANLISFDKGWSRKFEELQRLVGGIEGFRY